VLQGLSLQLEKAMGSGDLMVSSSDSDSDNSDAGVNIAFR
jgi:transcriptional regulator ATRX